MRLKQLELQGYKTFASRTQFIFGDGITAIVGPNGSGKSNIADAIRWALGEQSYRVLRAKRTEDMIFSGSERRARQGMAQVILTLDNAGGWLPIEFSEVTIERRAYRSGDNEYYLNGNRVRLRDITELLSQSGLGRRTYTVIGQGLVDRALSLGSVERRALFEEAAGIVVYQGKRTDALRKLERTQQNIVRVNDIINEITPRLRHLERQAERAREQKEISERLDALLRVWYGNLWREGTHSLRLARTVARHRQESLQALQSEMDATIQEIADLRARRGVLRASLSQWHRGSSELHARAEELQREMAVGEERARLLRAQREEVLAELNPLEVNRQEQVLRVEAAQAELVRLQAEVVERRAAVTVVRSRLDTRQVERRSLLAVLTVVQDRAFVLATNVADRDNRRTQIEERQAEVVAVRASHSERVAQLQAELSAVEATQVESQERLDRLETEAAVLQTRRADGETRLVQVESHCQEIQAQLASVRHEEERLRDRYDFLTRMLEEGEGFYAGVRAVLQAARPGGRETLKGIVGVLAGLIDVPSGLERAIEAALGARIQNIVVETWDDALAAVAFLKRVRGGRVTFVPLDTLRLHRPLRTSEVAGVQGAVGLASELVVFEERLRPAIELALGHTLVVEDMAVARRVFDLLTGGFQVVTRTGEVLRSDGALTGGTYRAAKDGAVLAREREWRDLPGQLMALTGKIEALEQDLAAAGEDKLALEASLSEVQAQAEQLSAQRTSLAGSLVEKDGEAGRLAQEIEWFQGLIQKAMVEAEALQARDQDLAVEREAILEEQAKAQGQIAVLQEELEAFSADDFLAEMNRLQTDLAVAEQMQASQETILDSHQSTLERLEAQVEARQGRVKALAQQAEEGAAHLTDLASRRQSVSEGLANVQARITPAEQEMASLEARRTELDVQEIDLRERLRQYEARHSRAVLEETRCQEGMAALKRRIEDDLGLVEVEMDESLWGQPLLPLRPIVSRLPVVEGLPEGLEEEMRHLRAQLRRLGGVNPNAPAEYEEQLERHIFLASQAEDLQQAVAQLREVIAELDTLMENAFRETIDATAKAFSEYFTRLFGGGTARLVLTDQGNVMESGVEIVARPPGRRAQGLALLSGGERALTATALIFAFLKVNPPPFSILDEVDATLDEANIGRFVELLQEQAQLNQFIVITHNRGTMKVANALYGVTMGDDSISRVYSKKLDDDESSDSGNNT